MEASASTPLRCPRCEQAVHGHCADGGHIAWCDCGDVIAIDPREDCGDAAPYVPAPRQPRAQLPEGPLPEGTLCRRPSFFRTIRPRRLLLLALVWGTTALLQILRPDRRA